MNGVKMWLYLETWLWIVAWVMLFGALLGKAVKAEREAQMRDALRLEVGNA